MSDLEVSFKTLLNQAASVADLEQISQQFLGKKGLLTQELQVIGQLPADQRKEAGQKINRIKSEFFNRIDDKKLIFQQSELDAALAADDTDTTLPAQGRSMGYRHPLTQMIDEILAVFSRLGYSVAQGPDVENDFYNFEALNISADHPARDMHDTFYLQDPWLLRTHTSPVQIRVLEKTSPPVKIVVPGKVYRRDSDVSHSPVFHQVEGLYVDKDVRFSELKGTLDFFLKAIFGQNQKVRFRPSYFPFTEPSAEVDVACIHCHQAGCRVCKQTGWLEILGCGMVHPRVLSAVSIDPEVYSGFAFGLGVERIAMLLYGVSDIRLFYENDLRFLEQF